MRVTNKVNVVVIVELPGYVWSIKETRASRTCLPPIGSPGSDQTKSDAGPLDDRGSFLILLISSTADIEGDKPPCTQNTLPPITALKLMKSKARVQYCLTTSDPAYFLLHSS